MTTDLEVSRADGNVVGRHCSRMGQVWGSAVGWTMVADKKDRRVIPNRVRSGTLLSGRRRSWGRSRTPTMRAVAGHLGRHREGVSDEQNVCTYRRYGTMSVIVQVCRGLDRIALACGGEYRYDDSRVWEQYGSRQASMRGIGEGRAWDMEVLGKIGGRGKRGHSHCG